MVFEKDKFFSPLLAGKHSGSQSPQLTQQQQPSPLRIQPSSSIQPQPQSPELTAYSKNDKETLYHSSMFRPPSPLQFNNNSSTNAAAPNQKHVFSVFNSSNNNIETTDPIFRHPSSSSTPTPHDHDSIKSNSTQQHNKQPSQTFNDSSPPTPSNNSGYNIHRDSHSNTFTSLTGPPLAAPSITTTDLAATTSTPPADPAATTPPADPAATTPPADPAVTTPTPADTTAPAPAPPSDTPALPAPPPSPAPPPDTPAPPPDTPAPAPPPDTPAPSPPGVTVAPPPSPDVPPPSPDVPPPSPDVPQPSPDVPLPQPPPPSDESAK
ncbi:17590_t:CDS:2 [Entrophospora sp. SA101]|nr:17590_t:CDS:2 [Entrophospora sp. SA101]